MRKLSAVAVALLLILGVSGVARADVGTIDAVPAATLLLPYFEVDLSNPSGKTTLMSINNASASAALARVTIWTDLGVPTLSFNVYLTGYDVQTINVRDILNGTLPTTASAGQDPSDTISNQGSYSQDINFASCGSLPYVALDPPLVADLQAAHTGLAAGTLLAGKCGGLAVGDGLARGYVTVDTVVSCATGDPSTAGYFSSTTSTQNILWGDYFYVDPANNYAQGDTLVHIEASTTAPETSTAGGYTFYGRYVAWDASDHRESLPSSFAARYLNGGAFTGGTTLTAWRDNKTNQAAFTCGTSPSWYPLGQEGIAIFDEQENVYMPPIPPFFPPPVFPALLPFPASASKVAPTFATSSRGRSTARSRRRRRWLRRSRSMQRR